MDTPCDLGEGDADRDADCLDGLVYQRDTGQRYGFPNWVDTCELPMGSARRCSAGTPCAAGEGDADRDSDCLSGLVYQRDTGDRYGFLSWVDTCELPPGNVNRCSAETPCDVGEGDADSDEDCLPGLIVKHNTGERYGFSSWVDTCEVPSQCPEDFFGPGGGEIDETTFAFPVESQSAIHAGLQVIHRDHDRDKNEVATFDGFHATYDDHTGTDFMLWGGFDQMESNPVGVRAAAPGVIMTLLDGEADQCAWSPTSENPERKICENNAEPRTFSGNHVQICHADGTISKYSHLKTGSITEAGLQVGQQVDCGDHLGLIGSSGNSAAPHLHFGVMLALPDTDDFETVDPYHASPSLSLWNNQGNVFTGLPGMSCN